MVFDPTKAVLGALAGLALGGLYFGGLWWTVKRAVERSSRPRKLLAVSGAVRLAFVMAAFYGLLRVSPLALVSSVIGFLGARQLWLASKGQGAAARRQGAGGTEREAQKR